MRSNTMYQRGKNYFGLYSLFRGEKRKRLSLLIVSGLLHKDLTGLLLYLIAFHELSLVTSKGQKVKKDNLDRGAKRHDPENGIPDGCAWS